MEENPNDPGSGVEDVAACQEVEITDGNTLNADERTDEAKDVWLVEMGDDSVFYSDEETTHQDREATLSGFSAKKSKHLVNSVAEKETNQKLNGSTGQMDKCDDVWAKEESLKLQFSSDVSDVKFGRSCATFLPPNSKASDLQTPNEFNGSTAEVNPRVRVKDEMEETRTSHPDPFHDSNKPQKPGSNKSEEDLETKCNFQANTELHRKPDQDQSTSSEPKSSDCDTFNHLASSKYSTVSYRRIQRGNTRQKIDEFEFMLKNQ